MSSIFRLFSIISIVILQLQNVYCATTHLDVSSKLPLLLDYKMHLKSGQRDWFYQDTEEGAVLSIDLNVLRGNSKKVGFAIHDPRGNVLVPFGWRNNASFETMNAIGGYYSFLIDNSFLSLSFTGVTVAVYISTYHQNEDWVSRDEFIEDFNESSKNISTKLNGIRQKINAMRSFLFLSRKLERMDMSLLQESKNLVQFWSVAQCLVIVLSGGLHVFFIRQFFKTPTRNRSGYGRDLNFVRGFTS